MESLKIRDKKILPTEEEIIEEAVTKAEQVAQPTAEVEKPQQVQLRRSYKTKRRSKETNRLSVSRF
jgi:cell division protein FtsA